MPLSVPPKREDFGIHEVTRGFCRALVAYSIFKECVDSGEAPTPNMKARAAIAQAFFYRLGLEPSPREVLTQTVKDSLVALVGSLEGLRASYDRDFQSAAARGLDSQAAAKAAKDAMPGATQLASQFTKGPQSAAISYLKKAFAFTDGGKTKQMTIIVSAKFIALPPTTELEKCMSLTQVRDTLKTEFLAQVARGPNTPDYEDVQVEPVEGVTFEEFRDATRDIQRDIPSPIYVRAPVGGNAGGLAQSNIYGDLQVADPSTQDQVDLASIVRPFDDASAERGV